MTPTAEAARALDGLDATNIPNRTIDITSETCPMTFVRVRLALDRLSSGEKLLVLLRGEEPLRNVPRTAAEQGTGEMGGGADAL